jgi:predicted transcriptional regulator
MKIKENKSFFLMQFGDTPKLRVLDFLIGFHFFDYPLTEIARESNVSYNSLKAFFPYFIQSGIVVKTRKVGKSDYFKLNLENNFVKNIIKLDWSLTKNVVLGNEKGNFSLVETHYSPN